MGEDVGDPRLAGGAVALDLSWPPLVASTPMPPLAAVHVAVEYAALAGRAFRGLPSGRSSGRLSKAAVSPAARRGSIGSEFARRPGRSARGNSRWSARGSPRSRGATEAEQ